MSFNSSGSKYLRVVPCITDGKIDVYAVLDAFAVTCPARQHAIKKLLCSGIRGKGDVLQDLKEAADAADRALQMETQRMVAPLAQPEVGRNPAPLCPSCRRLDTECHGAKAEYPATYDGGCEGYIKAEETRTFSDLQDDFVEFEKSERKAALCHSCHVKSCGKTVIQACEESGECVWYQSALRERTMEAKKEAAQSAQSCNQAWCPYHDPSAPPLNCQVYDSDAIVGCGQYHSPAKQEATEAPKPAPVALEICPSCAEHPGCKGTVAPAEDGSCKGFSAKEVALDPICAVKCKECIHPLCAWVARDITLTSCDNFTPKEAASDAV
jgi:hypothetical protein